MSQGIDILKKPVVIMKMIEVVLAIVLMGIGADSVMASTWIRISVVQCTFVGFFLTDAVLLLLMFVGNSLNKHVVMFVSFVAVVMFVAAGALVLDMYTTLKQPSFNLTPLGEKFSDKMLSAGIIAIINAVVHLVDVGLTYKTAETAPPSGRK